VKSRKALRGYFRVSSGIVAGGVRTGIKKPSEYVKSTRALRLTACFETRMTYFHAAYMESCTGVVQ
jgi:hypothetical protein